MRTFVFHRPKFPSPRPSPKGRGRTKACARAFLEPLDVRSGWLRFPLSLWERAGVRGIRPALVGPGCCFLALFFVVLFSAQAATGPAAAEFDAANNLYGQGKFSQAAEAYEKMLRSGQVSAAVYFNLGNAWFKAGEMGRALDAYRHAEHIAPRDPDVRANLQFTRNQVQGPSLPPTRPQRWLGRLTLNEWTWLAGIAVWLWFGLLTLLQLQPKLKPALKGWLLTVGLAAACLCAGLGAAMYQSAFARSAVVITREATVRTSPLEESEPAFTVRDGAELRVLDQKDEWLQVTADTGRIGWVRKDQVLAAMGASS
jgi:tetratricopeptide (TPR) repeat protein